MFSWIFRYIPSSTRSNKESQLIFSPDPASLERTIRKEAPSLSTDNNNSVSLDSAQPPSTQTPVLSTYSRSPMSTNNTNLPSTDTLHPTLIDIPSRTLINSEPREMVSLLILVRDNNGDLHDQEGHLRNAAGQRIDAQGAAIPETDATTSTTLPVDDDAQPMTLADYNLVKEEKLQEGDFEVESLMSFGGPHWCRSTPTTEHRSTGAPQHRSTTPMESTTSCNAEKILSHEEFAAKHPHRPSPDNVRIDRHANSNVDRHA
ncbi:hypothetical protein DY000_02042922 [Brassica cretica]|uniref:Uncharacterized protein n=1 Tax=Brassica cretica TaxID=69181 RepID=A0ABQ7BJD4_BRACR|nr:hypothetical protein DY000_02042922 [Brassica cretica]